MSNESILEVVGDYFTRRWCNIVCLALPIHLEHITQHKEHTVMATWATWTQTRLLRLTLKAKQLMSLKRQNKRLVHFQAHCRLVRGSTRALTVKLELCKAAQNGSPSSTAVVNRIPAGCRWEGAALWLIGGLKFGPRAASLAHQWVHFPSSSHSHARALPSYESARMGWESERQEVILPVSSPCPVLE